MNWLFFFFSATTLFSFAPPRVWGEIPGVAAAVPQVQVHDLQAVQPLASPPWVVRLFQSQEGCGRSGPITAMCLQHTGLLSYITLLAPPNNPECKGASSPFIDEEAEAQGGRVVINTAGQRQDPGRA